LPRVVLSSYHRGVTIYVRDHKGVIRHKNVRGEPMDKAVEQLLEELEKERPAASAQKK
jgi:hypothetical protein